MTDNRRIFYGKSLSASIICSAVLSLFCPPTALAKTIAAADRAHWPAATKRAIDTFAAVQDERLEQVHHAALRGVTLTAYTLDEASTGKSPASAAFGITASGTHAKVGRTVAVDPNIIPIGSLVYIPDIGWRVAEDSGGAVKGRHIDILLESRRAALLFGVHRDRLVYICPNAEAE